MNMIRVLAKAPNSEAFLKRVPESVEVLRVTSTIKEGEQLVQQGFELVGRDESGCLWRKLKTFEDITKEREQQFSFIKSENSCEKIL